MPENLPPVSSLSSATESRQHSQGDRLGSWKVIASYLRRSVRTVRRWEEKESLPVHRHQHAKGSTVFAFRSELDAWRQDRQQPSEITPPAEALTAPPKLEPSLDDNVAESGSGGRWRIARAAALTLAAVGLSLVTWLHVRQASGRVEPSAARREPVRVLLTNISSSRVSPEWARLLADALRATIINERELEPLSTERLASTLALMRHEANQLLTTAIAREVGMRDPRVGAVVAARAYDKGGLPTFEIEVIDAQRGVTLRSIVASITRYEELESVIQRLAKSTHRALMSDFSPRQSPGQPTTASLPRATTISIKALELLGHGERQLRLGRPTAATALFRQALEEDPELALAQIQLARALYRARASSKDYLAAADKAVSLAARASLPERYLVAAIRHQLAERPQLAQAEYRALVSLEPDHYWASRGLLDICRQLELDDFCTEPLLRLTEIAHDDLEIAYDAAWAIAVEGRDSEQAELLAHRVAEMLPGGRVETATEILGHLFAAQRSWLQRDATQAGAVMDELAARSDALATELPDRLLRELGQLELTLGRPKNAEIWFESIGDPVERHELVAQAVWACSKKNLRPHLIQQANYRQPVTAGLLAMSGLDTQATQLVASLSGVTPAGQVEVAQGVISYFDDQLELSITEISAGLERLTDEGNPIYFMGRDLLARAHARRGELERAITALEPITGRRARATAAGSGMFWLRCQANLAELYRQAGRADDAIELERELLRLLSAAGHSYPLVEKLRGRQMAVSS